MVAFVVTFQWMAAGAGNHNFPNPRRPNGVRELVGAIEPDWDLGYSLSPVLA